LKESFELEVAFGEVFAIAGVKEVRRWQMEN
jgi:hypothetical protein